MRNLKELFKLIKKNQNLIGEDKHLHFIDLEGNSHALTAFEMIDDELLLRYEPYETVITHEDLATIDFNDGAVQGMDVDNEPWKIVFEEFGFVNDSKEDDSSADEEDEDYKEVDSSYDDMIDDDNNILTSDDY